MSNARLTEIIGVRALRAAVAARLEGASAERVKSVTDAVLEAIAEALGRGDALTLPGLGSFRPASRAPRHGTGPDGRAYSVAARLTVKFRPARELAARLAAVESGAA